jgi:hypothetical protein
MARKGGVRVWAEGIAKDASYAAKDKIRDAHGAVKDAGKAVHGKLKDAGEAAAKKIQGSSKNPFDKAEKGLKRK